MNSNNIPKLRPTREQKKKKHTHTNHWHLKFSSFMVDIKWAWFCPSLSLSFGVFRSAQGHRSSPIQKKNKDNMCNIWPRTQHAFVRNFSYFCAPSCVLRCLYMVMVSVIVTTTLPKFANCYQIFVEATFCIFLARFRLGSSSGCRKN